MNINDWDSSFYFGFSIPLAELFGVFAPPRPLMEIIE